MQQELSQCKNVHSCFEKNTECCFGVANRYWNSVKERLKMHTFRNEENEIEFFKILKPKFTSEIEYYSLIYHCLLFQPPDLIQAIEFLGRESKRLEKFEEDNHTFIECYINDCCGLNRYYFLRKYYICRNEPEAKMHDAGTDAVTNGDPLAATLFALKRYESFVKERLVIISN
jgi:hypothetical protein